MKTIFVPAKSSVDVMGVVKKLKLPKKKICLVSTIQFVDQLDKAKEYLSKKGYDVVVGGQVLGCNVINALKTKAEVYVYIGSGEFHPLELVGRGEVYIANPLSGEVSKCTLREKKGKIAKFLGSDKIGILVSTKPGQENLKSALDLVNKLKKEAYVFVVNEIDLSKLEDFNDIEFWINTACPRIEGKNVIWMGDLNLS